MRFRCFATVALALLPLHCFAWNYEGHRAVNLLALKALPSEFPAWVHESATQERIAFLAGEPDRMRNLDDPVAKHINGPDHYLNIEEFEPLGLTAETVSDLRHRYTAQVAAGSKHTRRSHNAKAADDVDGTRGLPGYLPWAITESYHRLKSAFSYLKVMEEAGRAEDVTNARANVAFYMGVLGHYVGDAAQPLHTTRSYNGWSGDNPEGYTTSRSIHSWIDGGFLEKTGGISPQRLEIELRPAKRLATASPVDGRDPIFNHAMVYLKNQYTLVEPLYALEKEGGFSPENARAVEGRKMLEDQLCVAAQMLGSLWLTAWKEAPPDKFLRAHLLKEKASAPTPALKSRAKKTPSSRNP